MYLTDLLDRRNIKETAKRCGPDYQMGSGQSGNRVASSRRRLPAVTNRPSIRPGRRKRFFAVLASAIVGGRMKRRELLAAMATGAVALAKPAVAQSMPQLKWRLATSWPKSLDTLYGTCELFAKCIGEITDRNFHMQVFAAGEIVPGLAVLDAVQNQTVELGHTGTYYYWGKEAALAFGSSVPFGLNTRQ